MGKERWYRVRFYVPDDDYRPVKWPPPGPYWCSGFSAFEPAHSTLIAFVRKKSQLKEFWPDALLDEFYEQQYNDPEFSGRFPCPEWWDPVKGSVRTQ